MELRPFTEADISAVAAVEKRAAEFPWSVNQFRSSLAAGHWCTVLEHGGRLVGFSVFSKVLDEASLLNIAIDPAVQGRGFGRLLLERGLQAMSSQGAKTCFLEVRVSNAAAKALYQSLGFTVIGERKDYYAARKGREDALVMSRSLPMVAVDV